MSINSLKNPTDSSAPALTRGLAILKLIVSAPNGLSFNEILEKMNAPRTTVTRLLSVLREQNDLIKGEDGRYRIGPGMELFVRHGNMLDRLGAVARPFLKSLRDELRHTVLVIYFDSSQNPMEMVCIAKSQHELSFAMQPEGLRASNVDANPWGWLYFGHQSKATRQRLFSSMDKPDGFREHWEQRWRYVCEHQFAFDDDQHDIGIRRLAAPIRDQKGGLVAALGLGASPKALPKQQVSKVGNRLVEVSQKIQIQMGWEI